MSKEASAKKLKAKEKISSRSNRSMIEAIKKRQTDELVIAFCGPLGSGTSAVAKELVNIITENDYEVNIIKVSELISLNIDKVRDSLEKDVFLKDVVDLNQPISKMSEYERITMLQSAGNILRKTISHDILAQLTIKEISLQRIEQQEKNGTGGQPKRESRRFVTIIDSLKHPDEVTLLRIVYGNMFYLFGVLCPEHIRKVRLQEKGVEPAKAVQLMERDKSEEEKFGQQLLDTIFHSDFFVRNTKDNIHSFLPNLNRFISIILGDAPITPTMEESAMYYAQSAAVRSACLSRQVGASIINDKGELISIGCNDVPKFKGGLYTTEDGDNDNRCMNLYGKTCKNEKFKKEIFEDVEELIKDGIDDTKTLAQISYKIRTHERLGGLIEFCRAIHAEMDAITSAARKGGLPLKGTSMFCTTFPCHNCARHIIASGIKAVYYIEPYEKSLALDLHRDAIEFDPEHLNSSDSQNKVVFLPFEGVAPKRYLDLFKTRIRKSKGKKIEVDLKISKPIIVQLMDTYVHYESKVVDNLEEIGFDEINQD